MNRSQLFSALSNWLAFAATLAVAFLLTPFMIGKLGTARYDVWCVAEAVLAYFTLLDMGLAACIVRGVARHRSRGDTVELNRLASSCLALFSAAGAVALIVGVPVMLLLSKRYANDTDTLGFLVLMLLNLALTLPLSVFPSILDGLDRYGSKSAVRIAFLLIRTTFIVVLLNREAALMPLAILFTVVNVLEHLVLGWLSFRNVPDLSFRRQYVSRSTLVEIRGYSAQAFLAMLAGRITVQSGAIFAGLMLPLGAVTVFAVASRLVEYAKTLLRTITATLTPGVSAMETRGDFDGIRSTMIGATRLVLYLTLPIQLGLWFFGQSFLLKWVPTVGGDAIGPLMVLSLTLTLAVMQSVASRILYGLGRLKTFSKLALLESALVLLLAPGLLHFYGLPGLAWAIAIPNLLFNIAVIRHALQLIEIRGATYAKAIATPLLAATIPAAAWAILPAPEPAWASIFGTALAGLVPYGIAVLLLEQYPRFRSRRDVYTRSRDTARSVV